MHFGWRSLAVFAAVAAAVAAASTVDGCSCDQPVEISCASDADCAAGQRCSTGVCAPRDALLDAGTLGEGEGAPGEGEGALGEGEGAVGEGEGAVGEGEGAVGEGEGAVGEGEGAVGEGEGEGGVDAGPACVDKDNDGFAGVRAGCDAGPQPDCDDNDARVSPAHKEECDGLDNDCNGVVDDAEICGCIALRLGDGKDPRLLCLQERNAADAEAECEKRGYRLAIFKTQAEDDAVSAAFSSGLHVWSSLHRDPAAPTTFVWGDGSAPGFSEFASGQPDNTGGTESCVELHSGQWNDLDCAKKIPFLCEPAPTPPPAANATCIDNDGDHRGVGCPAGADCDDNDDGAFALVGGAEDVDHDGVTSQVRRLFCGNGVLDNDLLPAATAQVDCDDFNASVASACIGGAANCKRAGASRLPATYAVCTDGTDFSTADFRCSQRFNNGRLITISSQDIEDVVSWLVETAGLGAAWIGLENFSTGAQFQWIDGQSFVPSQADDFAPGEPNDFNGQEHCVEQLNNEGWNDTACSSALSFVCFDG